MGMVFRIFVACAATVVVGFVAACANKPIDLSSDAFVGAWRCGGTELVMTSKTVAVDGKSQNIAWIETGKNVDYGLFMTDGGRYSVSNTTRRSLNFYDHTTKMSRACTAA
ncbi:hypothetical protein RDV64_20280 [Acuticoccus sp. MNP-M23]|uniref:hypothetical protein n=1 Tax=Acuticoccus sp. MNP-M23 TaxID=3072793 RepID=UPI0028149DC0|nr:hypothetical protein [Acuticoccus sp. MNP-M23]WMS42373.1 hypothetical protein RDV64_20280 [Acuticoccus sp. MNP-M23]